MARPPARYRRDQFSDKAQAAIATSQRVLELHERGPMGRLEAHRALREVGVVRCPICEANDG